MYIYIYISIYYVRQVPLLDMKRYTKLLAGASWMAEYGDYSVYLLYYSVYLLY